VETNNSVEHPMNILEQSDTFFLVFLDGLMYEEVKLAELFARLLYLNSGN
jgi:hypothetical protein